MLREVKVKKYNKKSYESGRYWLHKTYIDNELGHWVAMVESDKGIIFHYSLERIVFINTPEKEKELLKEDVYSVVADIISDPYTVFTWDIKGVVMSNHIDFFKDNDIREKAIAEALIRFHAGSEFGDDIEPTEEEIQIVEEEIKYWENIKKTEESLIQSDKMQFRPRGV